MAVDARVDLAIQRLANAREGSVTTAQLHAAGLSDGAIKWRVKRGFLTWEAHGVYAVGDPALHRFGKEASALAAAGPRSLLTGGSGLYAWGLVPRPAGDVVLIVVGRGRRTRPGIQIRRVESLSIRDARVIHGLAVASPARALLDYAATASDSELESAIDEARAKKLLTPKEIEHVLARYPRRPGAARLKAILADESSGGTRSTAERKLRALLKVAGLPQPETNVHVETHLVDVVWRDHKLVIEFDGFGTHQTREAFEQDRARDRELAAKGYVVLRVTWRQLNNEPVKVIAQIAAALAHRRARAA